MEISKNTADIETLCNAVYYDKRLSKAQARTIEINFIIESTDIDKLNLKKVSIILVALSKILQKRYKCLLDEANHLYQLLSYRPTKKRQLTYPSKNITLNIENSNFFINDEMVDFGEDTLIKELENSIFGQSFENQGFEADFGDAISIEQVRESTLMSNDFGSNLFNNTNISINIKKRKVIEDSVIEIRENIFRSNLRTVFDIIAKPKNLTLDTLPSLITVDKKLINFFNKLNQPLPVEEQRHQDFEVDFNAPDITFDPIDKSFDNVNSTSLCSFLLFDDLKKLPKNFIFNLIIQQATNEEKAVNFLSLLGLATEGKIQVSQTEVFGAIDCSIAV